MRNQIDALEQMHITDAIQWIDSGEEIFRLEKPAIPPKHLVSYFVLVDQAKDAVLLLDHINAELWLPNGGHVEYDEHPMQTVVRELYEELRQQPIFLQEDPVFVTQATTVGKTPGHTDVSLWYVLSGDSEKAIVEVLREDGKNFDPHMHRFIAKLHALHLLG